MEEIRNIQRVSGDIPAAVPTAGAPKLLDRVRGAIRAKHYSRRTESAYVDWIRRYILTGTGIPLTWARRRSPRFSPGSPRLGASVPRCRIKRSALCCSCIATCCTSKWTPSSTCRARMPVRVPVVLSRDEVARIMKHLDGFTRIIVAFLYGAGLRLQECLELRVKDLDLEQRQIVIRRGKGQKDRPTVLPTAAIEPLERHLETVKRQHQDDLAREFGRVVLPFALDRK